MEGLNLWTELQNVRIEGEGLACRRLASSSSSKHLAACRRVKSNILTFNKHVVTSTPGDPSPTPCGKAIPEPHIHQISHVSIYSYIRSGYKFERPLPWTRYSNICLPCRGAPRYPTRSITLAGHTFLGSMPGLGRSTRRSPTYAQQRGPRRSTS